MKKIMICFGTRPEAIKMCPLIIELKKHAEFDIRVLLSGQHKEMANSVLDFFGIVPDFNLNIMKENQTLADITKSVIGGAYNIFKVENPDLVLVHGDTSSSYCFALAAFYLGIKIGHIEAGLRTFNIKSPFPEEFNRRSISLISDYDFAPSKLNYKNLVAEGKCEKNIFVVGNTGIDSLRFTISNNYKSKYFDFISNKRLVLLTCHRRENIGKNMNNIFKAIVRICDEYDDVCVVYPIHKNPKVRKIADKYFSPNGRVKLIEPLDVIDFHNLLNASYLVVTDSGGIQEEAPFLGKPVLVVRDTTERPEAIENGTCKLAGVDENTIYAEIKALLDNKNEYEKMAKAINPYGDGHSSEKIANILRNIL